MREAREPAERESVRHRSVSPAFVHHTEEFKVDKTDDDLTGRHILYCARFLIVCSADSWRARVSHICELQVNMASGAMSIDFGGMDRWDYPERVRNMAEAERGAA